MERPSHIIFGTRHFSHRLPLIGLAISLQAAAVWLLTHGLMSQWTPFTHGPIELVPIIETQQQPRVRPPEPRMLPVPIPTPSDPLSGVKFDPSPTGITTVSPALNSGQTATNPIGETRAPVGITATHTVPPYPPIARRLGAEGKVMLKLTVTAEGRVAQADIVTSSGSGELDQAAQAWIVAHWKYKPGLENGVPAVSQALATVTFSLINEH